MDQTEGNGEPGLARHSLGCTPNELIDVQIANAQVCKGCGRRSAATATRATQHHPPA
ncbi:hypothetical protein [Streptomyces sp. V1I1]|uniref:hypothetical protein n=1 Tax=Streptomyces sp. V1I1 TaxID=3042272 RepID=UPI002780818D|nr:hypothetical protein [Streptomyces sp. V1I1]MDQ0945844.1 hypothetical protein [Streptomyces sp. V1I1]